MIATRVAQEDKPWSEFLTERYGLTLDSRRLILVTGHRRENFGPGFRNICLALRDLVETPSDIHLVYPVHLNPRVQEAVQEILVGGLGAGQQASGALTLMTAGGGRLSLLPPWITPLLFI